MNWKRWDELMKVDQELGRLELLRRYTPNERLYLLDWRARLFNDRTGMRTGTRQLQLVTD
jgi:hypothetical protein